MRNDKKLRNTYWFRTTLGCCLGVLLILTLSWPSGVGSGLAQTESNRLTGCLTPGGTLTRLAPGDSPTHPCSQQQTQVTLNVGDPSGTSGTFYVALDRDTERTIATKGPHTFVCRCTDNGPTEVSVTIEATSTASEWFAIGFGPLNANQSLVLISDAVPVGSLVPIEDRFLTILDDTSYLSISTLRFGAGLFGRYCMVSGTVSSAMRTP